MIGEKIRKIRILKGYSQEYVSDRLGISQPAYLQIEKNKTKVTIETLNRLASIFEIEIIDLLGFDEKKSFITSNLKDNFENERELYREQINSLKEEILYLQRKLDQKN